MKEWQVKLTQCHMGYTVYITFLWPDFLFLFPASLLYLPHQKVRPIWEACDDAPHKIPTTQKYQKLGKNCWIGVCVEDWRLRRLKCGKGVVLHRHGKYQTISKYPSVHVSTSVTYWPPNHGAELIGSSMKLWSGGKGVGSLYAKPIVNKTALKTPWG